MWGRPSGPAKLILLLVLLFFPSPTGGGTEDRGVAFCGVLMSADFISLERSVVDIAWLLYCSLPLDLGRLCPFNFFILPEEARRVGLGLVLRWSCDGSLWLTSKTKKVDGIFCQDSNYRTPDLIGQGACTG